MGKEYCYRCNQETEWIKARAKAGAICCEKCGTYDWFNQELKQRQERFNCGRTITPGPTDRLLAD